MPQGLTLTYESFPHKIKWKKALAVLSETWASQAPCLTFIQRPTRRVLKKRKDFPMIGPFASGDVLDVNRPPLGAASTGLSSVEKKKRGID